MMLCGCNTNQAETAANATPAPATYAPQGEPDAVTQPTFLESVDVSGKQIIPFCTSASSPVGSSADNLHSLAPDALWEDGTRFAIGTTREEILEWLNQ